jgi:IMP cyclohydrolase
MYVGRFVVVAPNLAAYRVSSRSFPNRQLRDRDGTLTVGPTPDAPETDNPYVEYNCLRTTAAESAAVLGNGSHVDPIVEKLDLGYPPRDALATALLALDYEKDDYDTPRIAGVLGTEGAWIGIVRADALVVQPVTEPTLVATYETQTPTPIEFPATDAETAASMAYDLDYEHPVCAAGLARTDAGFETAIENGD